MLNSLEPLKSRIRNGSPNSTCFSLGCHRLRRTCWFWINRAVPASIQKRTSELLAGFRWLKKRRQKSSTLDDGLVARATISGRFSFSPSPPFGAVPAKTVFLTRFG
jgi:hypothetical protein